MSDENSVTGDSSSHSLKFTPKQWLEGATKELSGHEHKDLNWVWERILNHLAGLMLTPDLMHMGWADDNGIHCTIPLITYTKHQQTGLFVVITHNPCNDVWRSTLVVSEEAKSAYAE